MGKILVIVIILLFTSSLYLKASFGEATVKNKAQKKHLKMVLVKINQHLLLNHQLVTTPFGLMNCANINK
ncbi:MAG: hypothetical protein QM534_05475 [Sediminibacterium sp.]|nr:hypothetical protein [Sediminibacterium sp.]